MAQIRAELSIEEDEILEAFKYLTGENDKRIALKRMIREFASSNAKVKQVLKLKKGENFEKK